MSPLITSTKICPDCLADANLADWRPPVGYDPRMRQYRCRKCGNEFYIIGGERSYKTEAEPIEKS